MSIKCERCDGCGKIADSERGEPWKEWLALPVGSSAAVLAGIVKPIPCPNCGGTGQLILSDFTQRADAENNAAEPMTPESIPSDQDPVEWLIARVTAVIPESMQMGTEPLSTKAAVLAQLYQAHALRTISDHLGDMATALKEANFTRGRMGLFHALTGILKSLNDAKRNNPEAYLEFINEIAVDLGDACDAAGQVLDANSDLLR